jgi:glycosyltransferase involved in cell wall biosynthesis
VRVLLWHGWLLEGSGTNVFTARVAETLRADGHDVALVCQERHPERYVWIDAWGTVDAAGPSTLVPNPAAVPSPRGGRCVLLRPDIGRLLPVFVRDVYEGFEVKTFVELTDAELAAYLERNVAALRAAASWHGAETSFADHAVPGGPVAARALPPDRFVVKTAGSDVEYAMRPQQRYRDLAAEGIRAARALIGPSAEVLTRAMDLAGTDGSSTRIVPPGVDADRFRPRPRPEALHAVAERLEREGHIRNGRPAAVDADVERALAAGDAETLDALADAYDQEVPDPDAAARLRRLADVRRPLVASFGKLIAAKGPQLTIAGATLAGAEPDLLVVGFGRWREWVAAVALAVRRGDRRALRWLRERGALPSDAPIEALAERGHDREIVFTGRLDHRFAPEAIAAADVLVVPSIVDEAFGMVVAEGAAAGALPLVARHSGLAEVTHALETDVGMPGAFGFEPGDGAIERIAAGIDRLLALPSGERDELREELARSVRRRWSWASAARRVLS